MLSNEIKGNLYGGILLLLFGVGLVAGALNFEESRIMEMGPDFFPILIGTLMAGLSIVLIIMSSLKLRSEKAVQDNSKAAGKKDNVKYVAVAFGLLIIYMLLFLPLGFRISSSIYMIAQMCFLAEKRTRRNITMYIVISITIAFLVNYIFVKFLNLMLPTGILGI